MTELASKSKCMCSVTYLQKESMCLLSLHNRSLQARHAFTWCNHSWCHSNTTVVTHSSSTNMGPPSPSNLKQVDLSLHKHITRNIVTEATTWHVLLANTMFINDLKVAEIVTYAECIYNCVLLHYKIKKTAPEMWSENKIQVTWDLHAILPGVYWRSVQPPPFFVRVTWTTSFASVLNSWKARAWCQKDRRCGNVKTLVGLLRRFARDFHALNWYGTKQTISYLPEPCSRLNEHTCKQHRGNARQSNNSKYCCFTQWTTPSPPQKKVLTSKHTLHRQVY